MILSIIQNFKIILGKMKFSYSRYSSWDNLCYDDVILWYKLLSYLEQKITNNQSREYLKDIDYQSIFAE